LINIAELGSKAASYAPNAPALIDAQRGAARTFGELSDRVDALALCLVNMFGPGQRVAVLSRNSIEMVELYLACAASGSLLFPLNWRFSSAQLTQALQDSDPVVVFYEKSYEPVVKELSSVIPARAWVSWETGHDSYYEELLARAITSGRHPASTLHGAAPLPKPSTLLHKPFLAVSTGGTTGIPKSAVHTQYSYAACAMNYLAAARIAQTDVYLMLGQLFHVVGYMPLAYLAAGRPVVIANFNANELVGIIRQEQVSGFFAIATMLPQLMSAVRDSGVRLPSVRQVEYGGAPMGEEVIRGAAELFEADMIQAWGMSELGPGTYLGPEDHRRAFAGDHPHRLRSCGRSALLSTVAVLGEDGRPVPRDGASVGEICHRGPGNMTGYWNKPDETAELLRDGWVHSGDIGTWDEDGYVFIVDRKKSMIISGGENIFPAEVERALGNHPEIAEVVVVGIPDPTWGEVVKALVVRRDGSALDAAGVTAFAENQLGSYKKPRIVEFVEALPVTPTGKVDRRAAAQTASFHSS
jgi:acyl-CoA synthetase (AMP-forming)/AMP-acid ligase II